MRFQITGSWGWPVTGDKVIPAGQILDYEDENDMQAQWAMKSGCLPVNTLCLDSDAWAYACSLYPPHSSDSNRMPQLLAGVVAKDDLASPNIRRVK
jgi:hypothetical protein